MPRFFRSVIEESLLSATYQLMMLLAPELASLTKHKLIENQ
jgi:hypothetical protein